MPKAAKAGTPKVPERRLSNFDYTDRELLANIDSALGPDGWATTTEIAIDLGFNGNGKKNMTPARKVATRLVWMRAGGLLESMRPDALVTPNEPGARDLRWRLTPIGIQIMKGTLSKAVSSAIDRADPGAQLLMAREILTRGYEQGDTGIAFALRREAQHRFNRRKVVYRGRT